MWEKKIAVSKIWGYIPLIATNLYRNISFDTRLDFVYKKQVASHKNVLIGYIKTFLWDYMQVLLSEFRTESWKKNAEESPWIVFIMVLRNSWSFSKKHAWKQCQVLKPHKLK